VAEFSRLWDTQATGGDRVQLTQDDWISLFRNVFAPEPDKMGVLRKVGGELAVTVSGMNVQLASGAAITYGFHYQNSQAVPWTVPSSVSGPTGHALSLRVNWTARTVRSFLIPGADGNPTPPSFTFSPGSSWDVPLATFVKNTDGTITSLVDRRRLCEFATVVTDDMIGTRTLDAAQAPPTPTGKLLQLLNYLLKAINGKASLAVQNLWTEQQVVIKNTVQTITGTFWAQANMRTRTLDGSYPAYSFEDILHNVYVALYMDEGMNLRTRLGDNRDALLWSSINDGANSGLDADLWRGRQLHVGPTAPTGAAPGAIWIDTSS